MIQKDIIDEEYPEEGRSWSNLSSNDQEYYQLLLEDKAARKGMDIFLCKKMWCARNILRVKEQQKTVDEQVN